MNNILILGNGGREKVIAEKLKNHNIHFYSENHFQKIRQFCLEKNIDLVIPSSEVYLCSGIKDALQKTLKNVKVYGPNKFQAKLEGSKYFSKKIMNELNLPTAEFAYFKTFNDVSTYIETFYKKKREQDIVIKYSGLAKGKGVYLPKDYPEAKNAIIELHQNSLDNFKGIVVEQKLVGTEVSVLAFCNGNEAYLMPQAQDYKRIYDNDKGPNTGGMGAICPVNVLTKEELILVNKYMNTVVKKLHYNGVLYAGIMKTNNGIYFLEFNCRFGDPEAQVILNLLKSDLYEIINDSIKNKPLTIKWSNNHAATVVLSHVDYPYSKLEKPVKVEISENIDNTVKMYYANIQERKNQLYTTGGRVLNMVSIDNSIQQALENIYNNIYKITYNGVFYRRDIGSNYKIKNKNKIPNVAVLASGLATSIEALFYDDKTSNCIKVFISDKTNPYLLDKASSKNIPYIHLPYKEKQQDRKYYETMVDFLRYYDIEIVILCGYMRIVPDILFNEFYTINIHPSLLPKYKNMTGDKIHQLILKNRDKFIGCTLHQVTKNVDEGRILLQKQSILDKRLFDLTLASNSYHVKNQIQTLEKHCIYKYILNYSKEKTTYDIDINEGNKFVDDLKKQKLIKNDFCSSYIHKGVQFGASADGCGTKLDMANIYNFLEQIGIDLVAMNVNDLIAGGCKPLFFMDYIAIDKMDRNKCNKIIKGIIEGCRICDCKLIGGETAEMKGIYLKNKLDLAGFAIGEKIFDLPKKNLIDTNCYLYGLKSSGIHSNGYTLVKKLWEKCCTYKPKIEDILTPTKIYYELMELYKTYENNILGVAHITGGGFHDNIIRILPEHLYFQLYDWEFSDIFNWIKYESKLTKKEMLGIFNCGYGMVVITNKEIDIGDKIGKIIRK